VGCVRAGGNSMAWHKIDYDGLWSSDKLNRCSDEAQVDYTWIYGIADAWGCFELTNLRVVLGTVAPIRKKLTIERLEQDFVEYQANGLCFVWVEGGKKYSYWTGCEGRLPPLSTRNRYARTTPAPPKEQLECYVQSFTSPLTKTAAEVCEPSLEAVAMDSRLDRDNGSVTVTETEREQTQTPARPSADVCVPAPPQPVEPTNESQAREPEQLTLGQLREKKSVSKLLLEIYEQERGPLPAVKVESPERLSKARSLLLSHVHDQEKFLADFRAAVRKASQLAWPTSWRPAFDWFVDNGTNYAKVLEGNYDK
jgi:hypothetical protein